jgi:hypothetical protein
MWYVYEHAPAALAGRSCDVLGHWESLSGCMVVCARQGCREEPWIAGRWSSGCWWGCPAKGVYSQLDQSRVCCVRWAPREHRWSGRTEGTWCSSSGSWKGWEDQIWDSGEGREPVADTSRSWEGLLAYYGLTRGSSQACWIWGRRQLPWG